MRTARGIQGILCLAILVSPALAADRIPSIQQAIRHAVTTNPGVGEATANRRATEAEWRQAQGVLLPQVRLEADVGRERRDLAIDRLNVDNNRDRWGQRGSVVVRQLLFDGFTSLNEIWRHAARVDGAAYRVRERTELLALDAAEAYIDVVRFSRAIGLAD